jgi:Domain of unknown function (DUF4175)
MNPQYDAIRALLAGVRARWRRLTLLHGTVRAALAATIALAVLFTLTRWTAGAPGLLAAFGVAAFAAIIAGVVWGFRSTHHAPSDRQIARFIEEQVPSLDDRLVTAVDAAHPDAADRPALADSMIADAARASASIDAAEIVPQDRLRYWTYAAAAAALLLAIVTFVGRGIVRQSFDAVSLSLFPSQVRLDVTPGNARIEAGRPLKIEARLRGNRAPVTAQLRRAPVESDDWRAVEMAADAGGGYGLAIDALSTSFRYMVAAGALKSPVFEVTVVRAPRVARIDVEYTYPKGLGLAPRVDEDGGDIYAPAGTDVKVRVHTDRKASSGKMMLAGGGEIQLTGDAGGVLTGALQVSADNSYRVALADAEGLTSRGDTEYFIRTLEDRPPEVHVVRPASDRRVTRLEEVDIEAEAQDDFGIEGLDLVYAVRGGPEKVVPLRIPKGQTNVTSGHTLFIEELDVQPGDFVSYYVRARDLARGKRASETRSDIFFLEVKPFEQEFSLAQSQVSAGGGGSNRQIDDLVAAQKEIIVATWKLDRRAEAAKGAKSEQDIKSVGRAEAELKTHVEETSSSFRESNMRDPRRRPQGGRGGPPQPDGPRAGQTLPEEDAMTLAATAMGKAVTSLDALKTNDAIPSEMEALNQLLRAQADVKKRQVQRQQAGGGSGGNRSTQDMSSLFDKELARHQQTNYETPSGGEQPQENQNGSALDKIRDLARRQDELLKRQQELAQNRALSEEELKRELEKLTREQNELRQRAEDLAQQMARQQGGESQQRQQQSPQGSQQSQSPQGSQSAQSSSGSQSSQSPKGSQNAQGQQQARGGQQQGQQGQNGSTESGQLRDITEEMRSAASDLRRQDAGQASERAARALQRLRDLERQLQAATPDGRRRALGDLQLEARQLADAQRQIASESTRGGNPAGGQDAQRRLAGEEERLADRLRRMEDGLKQQASGSAPPEPGAKPGAAGGGDKADAKAMQQAAGEAARDIERQRLAERMQQSADAMRSGGTSKNSADAQQEIARALDRVADRLTSAGKGGDEESRKLTGQLSRARELRDRLDDLGRQLQQLDQQGAPANGSSRGAQSGQRGQNGQSASSSAQSSGSTNGKPGEGQGQNGGRASGDDVARLREDANRQMAEVRELMDQLSRDEGRQARGGMGFTFEGQGMVLSAPGTESWKQDFAKWQELKRQATTALDAAETTLSKKLEDKASKDHLAAGVDDKAPAAYQEQVNSYFKALAAKKK